MSAFDPNVFLASLTTEPGVYKMLNTAGKVIYVGKARNLKKRVSSYFRRNILEPKTVSLVQNIADIKVTVTRSDTEAIILENDLIKQHKPRYNILLKDDKSYPYLYLSKHPKYPSLNFYRGARRNKGNYFGPYPSAGAVRETLTLIQKIFKVRSCSDSFFRNRTRPCLQYFIKRCTAPCVGYVSSEDYQLQVKHAVQFLKGKGDVVINTLIKEMDKASDAMEYERAAHLRDQIKSLRKIQQRHTVVNHTGEVDLIAVASDCGHACVIVLFIRGGRLLGNKVFFPKMQSESSREEILSAFMSQYYLNPLRGEAFPKKIMTNIKLPEASWIVKGLSEHAGKKISMIHQVRGQYREWMDLAEKQALHALAAHIDEHVSYRQRLEHLQKALHMPNTPEQMACFDVSHTFGVETVASCVVFDAEGPAKKYYRRFNIEGVKKSDDYGALKQAITRHFTRLKKDERTLPDILIIDGGKGQLHVAEKVLEECQVDGVVLMSISKGAARKSGEEKIWLSGQEKALYIAPDSPAFHVLQHIRDEAHRFAIAGHRKKRGKAVQKSMLDDIPGVGPKRRQALLKHFGGAQELRNASVHDIAKVEGISMTLAKEIYDALR